MALPDILLPDGVPNFVVDTQSFGQLARYSGVPRGAGHSRKRRVKTSAPRVITVGSKELSQAQMTALDEWFEDTLLTGQRAFSVQLSAQGPGGPLWWSARWVKPWKATPKDGGRWVVTGQLHLAGSGSSTPPVTGALAFEYGIALDAIATIEADGLLAFEYGVQLLPDAPLAFEYGLDLVATSPHFLLIGSGFRLLIGDGKHLRIG